MSEQREPTSEEIKGFWEWYGIVWENSIWVWYSPDGKKYLPPTTYEVWYFTQPYSINLIDLFKFAVPKLLNFNLYGNVGVAWKASASILPTAERVESSWVVSPELAVFWSLNQLVEKKT